jgi:hypothetical protein
MKKLFFTLMIGALSIGGYAQTVNELEMFKSMFKIEKKAMLMDFLKLNDAEATAFWPIYEEYQKELGVLADRRIQLIMGYVNNYGAITAQDADAMMKESSDIIIKREKLRAKYYERVKKAAGSIRAAQFVQFERFVQNSIDMELNNNMPLIGELD